MHPIGVKLGSEKRRYPVGAGVGLGVVGTLASPREEGEGTHENWTRATQTSPLPTHTAPTPTGRPLLSSYVPPFFLHLKLMKRNSLRPIDKELSNAHSGHRLRSKGTRARLEIGAKSSR